MIRSQLVLNSMHKYQPRIHLVKRPDSGTAKPITDLEKEPHKTFIFPEAIFTAVTAYQNQLVSVSSFFFFRYSPDNFRGATFPPTLDSSFSSFSSSSFSVEERTRAQSYFTIVV